MAADLATRVAEAQRRLKMRSYLVGDPGDVLSDCWAEVERLAAEVAELKATLVVREKERAIFGEGQDAAEARATQAEADAERLRAALEVAETHIADDTCRHDYEKAPALHAIRAALAGKEGP